MLNDAPDALAAALLEIERFVGHGGWDQPARLFALVETDALIAAEPTLAADLGLRGSDAGAPADALTSVEQEDFRLDGDLGDVLAAIAWPPTVRGCALSIERAFMPGDAPQSLPADPDAAAFAVSHDPAHDEIRIVAGAVRVDTADPRGYAIARVRSNGELLAAADLVPGLEQALAATLSVDVEPQA